jgi:hypothetical protein
MPQQRVKKAIQAWFDGPEVAEIDQWRRQQDEIPNLAEAMRVLVKRGLAVSASKSDKGRSRAAAAE